MAWPLLPLAGPLNLQRCCRLLAALWMGLIFYLSHQPSIPVPALFPLQDKLFHGVVFGILGAFYLGSMRKGTLGYSLNQAVAASLCVLAYGAGDELHQYFVPGRSAEILDILADFTGGLLTVLLLRFMTRRAA